MSTMTNRIKTYLLKPRQFGDWVQWNTAFYTAFFFLREMRLSFSLYLIILAGIVSLIGGLCTIVSKRENRNWKAKVWFVIGGTFSICGSICLIYLGYYNLVHTEDFVPILFVK
jgi:uncharacterized membrane protein HdeD (DUF308 family)